MLLCCLIWCKKDAGWALSPPNARNKQPPLTAETILLMEENPKMTMSPTLHCRAPPRPPVQLVERNRHQSVVV